MKLAEALIERAAMQNRLAALASRINANIKVQEGTEPAENVTALVEEYTAVLARLQLYIAKINFTNCNEKLGDITIMEAIAKRDCLMKKINLFRNIYKEATERERSFTRSEIKMLSTVKAGDYQTQIDSFSKEYRELDTQIQAANWNTDIEISE